MLDDTSPPAAPAMQLLMLHGNCHELYGGADRHPNPFGLVGVFDGNTLGGAGIFSVRLVKSTLMLFF